MNGELTWFKSSYSDGDGSACVEVALSWRKSSHSDDEGSACVEVATTPHTVHLRDLSLIHISRCRRRGTCCLRRFPLHLSMNC
ncbi:DUF397 domain-containing protein [Streptomyces specialis]|uniref:DUF397 domain-containing protein n=1 Tax=Streptomyces specialis TaxID=498367 RepID=UPI00099EAD35|nr:DUF397 domain-containing protein [Streptomyces specialis]